MATIPTSKVSDGGRVPSTVADVGKGKDTTIADSGKDDAAGQSPVPDAPKNIPYPKAVFFIFAMEFCERYSYYGMRAILSIFFSISLLYPEERATSFYHIFVALSYAFALMGAIVSDSFLGKYRTIMILGIVYCFGAVTFATADFPFMKPTGKVVVFLGLFFIAMGTGGIKPCVAAFGADQFKLPEQEKQLDNYFSIFYACINSGSLLSTFVTPVLRSEVKCFGQENCFPLAFGVPAALMVTALCIYCSGTPFYNRSSPKQRIFFVIIGLITYAISQKIKKKEKREHWLDNADSKYTPQQIHDVKILLQIIWLFLPIPLFWSLYEQQGSTWTFQATRMDGSIGFYIIKPDQMSLTNAVLILPFIPLFNKCVYPLMAKLNLLKKPLQRIIGGGILISSSFICAAIIEIALKDSYPIEIPDGTSYLHGINAGNETFTTSLMGRNIINITIQPGEQYFLPHPIIAGNYTLAYGGAKEAFIQLDSGKAVSFLYDPRATPSAFIVPFNENPYKERTDYAFFDKTKSTMPTVRFLIGNLWCDTCEKTPIILEKQSCDSDCQITFEYDSPGSQKARQYRDRHSTISREVPFGTYKVVLNGTTILSDMSFKPGGSYVISITGEPVRGRLYVIVEPNHLSMLLQLPQYILITASEVMFSITLLDFSYREAPDTMKTVLQAAWLMTVAFGNMIIAIIAKLHMFPTRWAEFLFFAALMILGVLLFTYMAYLYTPAKPLAEGNNEPRKLTIQNAVGEREIAE